MAAVSHGRRLTIQRQAPELALAVDAILAVGRYPCQHILSCPTLQRHLIVWLAVPGPSPLKKADDISGSSSTADARLYGKRTGSVNSACGVNPDYPCVTSRAVFWYAAAYALFLLGRQHDCSHPARFLPLVNRERKGKKE